MTLKAQESYHLRVEDWVASNNLQDMVASPTGVSKIFASLSFRNIVEMLTGNVIAVITIGAMMVFTLRSFSIGLISVITNAVPALITFGLWAIFVGRSMCS